MQNIKENEILPFTKSLLFRNHLKKVRIYKSPVLKNDRKTQKDKNLKHLQTSSQFYSLQRKSTDKLMPLRSQAYQSLLRYSNSLKSGNSLPQKVNNSPKFYTKLSKDQLKKIIIKKSLKYRYIPEEEKQSKLSMFYQEKRNSLPSMKKISLNDFIDENKIQPYTKRLSKSQILLKLSKGKYRNYSSNEFNKIYCELINSKQTDLLPKLTQQIDEVD